MDDNTASGPYSDISSIDPPLPDLFGRDLAYGLSKLIWEAQNNIPWDTDPDNGTFAKTSFKTAQILNHIGLFHPLKESAPCWLSWRTHAYWHFYSTDGMMYQLADDVVNNRVYSPHIVQNLQDWFDTYLMLAITAMYPNMKHEIYTGPPGPMDWVDGIIELVVTMAMMTLILRTFIK